MTADSARWWENYLVRYFLPSIAGMFILIWLDKNTSEALSEYIPFLRFTDTQNFDAPQLLLWMLFGSLYCYIASYPCLVFHATRVLDFKDVTGNPDNLWCNPYLASIIFTCFTYLFASLGCLAGIILITVAFSFIQIARIYIVVFTQKEYGFDKLESKTSLAFAYLNKLSKYRSIVSLEEEIETEDLGENTKLKVSSTYKDVIDSYRHLREHGNTAFIFLLELALCPVFYVVLNHSRWDYLVVILILWIFPSVLTHGLAQHLERRFSRFRH